MFYYAQIDKDNICFAISSLSNKVTDEELIPVSSTDADVLHRKYEDGQWSKEKFLPEDIGLETTTEDKINFIYYKLMEVI